MPVNDALGTRMKTFYEQVPKTRLVRRMPVAIRSTVKPSTLLPEASRSHSMKC